MDSHFNSQGALSTPSFLTLAETLYLKRLHTSILPEATVYLDETSACLWNHSLLKGGLLRFLNESRASSVRPLEHRYPEPFLRPASPKKVFLIAVHVATALDRIAEIIRASPTVSVYILSSTPLRSPYAASFARPSGAFGIEDPIAELQRLFSGIHIEREYLPMTWATFLPNCLVLSPFVSVVLEESKINALAVSLFGLLQANDLTPNVWTLGPTAKKVGQSLTQIWQELDADDFGHNELSLVIVDRLCDLVPIYHFKSKSSSLLSTIFQNGLLPQVSLSVLSGPDIKVPFAPYGQPILLDWLQLLTDYPGDGVSLLRKKSMDLGAKTRILGKPTASQFTRILAGLSENKAIVHDSMEALLFLGLTIEALSETSSSSWRSEASRVQSASELPRDDLFPQILRLIETAPSPNDALKLGLWGYFKTESDVLIHKIAKWLPPNFDLDGTGTIVGLITSALHAAFHDPEALEYLDFKRPLSSSFMRFLSSRPKAPSDFKRMILCVSGAVSIEEMSNFRKLCKQLNPDAQKEICLVSTGVESGMTFF